MTANVPYVICVKEIRFLRWVDRKKENVNWVDINKDNYNAVDHSNVDYVTAMGAMHVIDKDGKVLYFTQLRLVTELN